MTCSIQFQGALSPRMHVNWDCALSPRRSCRSSLGMSRQPQQSTASTAKASEPITWTPPQQGSQHQSSVAPAHRQSYAVSAALTARNYKQRQESALPDSKGVSPRGEEQPATASDMPKSSQTPLLAHTYATNSFQHKVPGSPRVVGLSHVSSAGGLPMISPRPQMSWPGEPLVKPSRPPMISLRPQMSSPCDSSVAAITHPYQTTPNTTLLGTCTLEGRKTYTSQWTNQDTFLAKQLSDEIMLLAVIDGHGEHGHVVAKYVRDFILENAQAAGENPVRTLKQIFRTLQDRLEKSHLMHESQFSGCTATVAVVDTLKETMTVAYVGDSRLCVVDSKGKPVFETVDHTVSGEDESHILASGADVRVETICGVTARRVYRKGERYPGLAMSRSLGDSVAHTLGVQSAPTVVTVPLIAEQTVVVASDGVWEHMTAEDVAAIVCQDDKSTTTATARNIVYAARDRWGGAPNVDDITSVVFRNSGRAALSTSPPRCASPGRLRAGTA
eukprot:gnl/MRDRNA2_/MRDRNA2_93772_c0_seq1.p1 gnl/MRDRNA2_/MRDRNA2_93772_c0~~gnl/MRDRNA2_/MRDRNA2_93772_c0_seq1.p1  ORF type:complete len:534 (+),score=69.99 gnl/MRDRNA2_/MRDRNA2_93772_c0_seq1:100-1602(+)